MPNRPENGSSPAGTTRPALGDDAAPGSAGTGENICPDCNGRGELGKQPCPKCDGTGKTIEGIGGG